MLTHRRIVPLLCLILLSATACTVPLYTSPSATPTKVVRRTKTPPPLASALASPIATAAESTNPPTTVPAGTSLPPTVAATAVGFCADAQPTALINSLKSALVTSDGALLASLVSPNHGMDARFYRYGRIVNYDREHAKFLFETTYVVNWGPAPGSGLDTKGSFHDVFVPALLDVLNKNYTLTCNQLRVGGTTYQASWPYPGIDFYSVYFPGTEANGSLDWHTWLLGMHYVAGKPYLYAIMQFQWEP